MDENREVHLVPVPVVREQRALSEVGTGIEEIFARAGMSPIFLGLIQHVNDAIVHALQFVGYGESAVETVGFTLWPDERNPVVDRYIKPQGRFVLKIEASPGENKPQAKLLVCASSQLRNLEPAWTNASHYASPRISLSEGHLWRLDQLQNFASEMFPGKAVTVQVVNLRSSREDEELQVPFTGPFAELTQSTLEDFRDPTVHAEWEVRIEGVRLPVLYFRVESPRREMKAYCNVVFFYYEGAGAEVERELELLCNLFRNLPNPFNDDVPYGA